MAVSVGAGVGRVRQRLRETVADAFSKPDTQDHGSIDETPQDVGAFINTSQRDATFSDTQKQEQQKRIAGAVMTKLISATIGDCAVVMARSSSHKHYSFADLEWIVLPAVAAGQIYIAEAQHEDQGFRVPVAFVTWAKVSTDVDKRLRDGAQTKVRLQPDEWTSGDTLWLIDMVGDPRGIASALGTLQAGPFKDKTVNVKVRDADGSVRVETLAALVKAAEAAKAQDVKAESTA